MPIKKPFTPLNAVTLFSAAAIACILGVYVVFDYYLDSVGRELMSSWLQTEAVDIQEGNLLSTITKNQIILLSSQFIKGVTLFDTETAPPGRPIEIGVRIEPKVDTANGVGKITVVGDGFFRKQAIYWVPNRPGLVLIFEVESAFLQSFFFFTVAALLLFIIILFGGIKVVQRREFAIENAGKMLLGDLAAQVAHDIRGPAAAIQQILRESKEIHGYKEIQAELEQMQALARKLLRQYRGEEAEELSEKFSLTSLMLFIGEEAKTLAKGKCEVLADIPQNEVFVQGVRHDLASALTNVVRNSIEAMHGANGRIAISLTRDGERAKIEIKDNGCGISENAQRGLFEQGVTHKSGGTGLGLFQAKSVTVSMGGNIALTSSAGKGTTVEIQLPLAPAEPTASVSGIGQIVLIDDSPANHLAWSGQARRAGRFLASFESPDSFIAVEEKFDRSTPIYVDYLFDGEPKGIAIVELLLGLGFSNVFLATSFPREKILAPRGVRVVDKDFPNELKTACLE